MIAGVFFMVFLQRVYVSGQDSLQSRSVFRQADSIHIRIPQIHADSTKVPDSLLAKDTIKAGDTIHKVKPSKSKLETKVEYSSKDSLRFEIKDQKVFLYKEADISYKDINLKANYVEIDFPKNVVNATYTVDSTGKLLGVPQFKESAQTFKSKIISYNYQTKQGYIQNVFTKQDEGYLHGTIVKKMENNVTYIRNGSYTTCDLEENPHYEFRFGKGKVIPGKRIITGPAYLIIAQVPTPLAIPFGFFPNRTGRRSGIVIPSYGESNTLGFYLQGGGYYWSLGDYADALLVGDIYSHGSWAVHPVIRYNYRYHYNGQFKFGYTHTRNGDPYSPTYNKKNDFELIWSHAQDSKARPHSTFSANVNIVSSTYNKNNLSSSATSYLSNTFQSSINYSTNWNEKYFLTLNFNHQQNTLNKSIDITLPQLQFSVNQFYPFKRQKQVGKPRWYEKISIKYNLDAENRYTTTDSTILKGRWIDSLRNGVRHTVPISGSFKILKYFMWTNSLNLSDNMYLKTIRKRYIDRYEIVGKDTLRGYYKADTVPGFANAFNANFSTSVTTRIYGMIQFKKGPVRAIRHMVTPSVSFVYTPYFGAPQWGYWKTIENDTNKVPGKYSIFEQSVYGGPANNKSGVVNFGISNNLEMKVRSKKDTVTGMKKIVLIEDLSIRASYDIARDSLKWSKIAITGYTTLFKNLRINYSSTLDPYARDSLGHDINKSEWQVNHRLLRLDNTSWQVGLTYTLSSDKAKKTTKQGPAQGGPAQGPPETHGSPGEQQEVHDFYDTYVDFKIPWSFSLTYSFWYNKDWNSDFTKRVGKVNTHTIAINGMLNLTPKWKVTVTTGYDLLQHALSYTQIGVYRDLHCWEMSFNWVPKGGQQQWDFHINVKASLLQDLKLNKKKDFRDYAE